MNSVPEKSKEASFKEIIEIVGITIGLIVTIFGAVIGAMAYREYKTTNELTMSGQLQTVDREISMLTFTHPNLHALWVSPPDNLHGKDRADALLKAFLPNAKDKAKISGDTWKTVRDIETILWSEENIHDQEIQKLRNAYTQVESILYLVCSAIDAEQGGKLRAADAKTYVAYLHDLGAHPLFLHALWYGHKGGYFSPEVAKHLQNELLKNEETKRTADIIYKELLDKDWAQRTGKSN